MADIYGANTQIRIKFDDGIARRFKGWTMHVYWLGARNATYTLCPLYVGVTTYKVNVQRLKTSKTVKLYGVGFDLFQPVTNYAGVENCMVHIGWGNRFCLSKSTLIDIVNGSFDQTGRLGRAQLDFETPKGETVTPPPDVETLKDLVNGLVMASMAPFDGVRGSTPSLIPHRSVSQILSDAVDKPLNPCIPFVRRVHAPLYSGARFCKLPGWAYYILQPLRSSEAWLMEWVRVGCRRRSLREDDIVAYTKAQFECGDDVVLEGFSRVCSLLVEVCTSPVTAYPYVSDFYRDCKGKKVNWESFDPFFVRQCGDCEDATKAICRVLRTIATFKFTSPVGVALGKVARLYLSVAVLGVVSQRAYKDTGQTEVVDPQAHMFAFFVPFTRFRKWTGTKINLYDDEERPWMKNLECWIAEGTGRILPFSHVGTDTPAVVSTVMSQARAAEGEEFVPSHGRHNTFYHLMVHMYTDALLLKGGVHGAFSFVARSTHQSSRNGRNGRQSSHVYGMKISDVLDSPDDVLLVPHPSGTPKAVRDITEALQFEHPDVPLQCGARSIGSRVYVPSTLPRGDPSPYFIDAFMKKSPTAGMLEARLHQWSQVVNVTRVDILCEAPSSDTRAYRVRWHIEPLL